MIHPFQAEEFATYFPDRHGVNPFPDRYIWIPSQNFYNETHPFPTDSENKTPFVGTILPMLI